MRFSILLVWAAVFIFGYARPGDAAPCATVTCRTVVNSVEEILASSSNKFADSNYENISVTCYYLPATLAKCAGGGDFDRSQLEGQDCRNNADGVTIIADAEIGSSTQCFERKNFGLNGIVDARQCGVRGDGIDHLAPNDDADLLVNCMNIAAANGYYTVSTGGGVILDNTTDITVPGNIYLTCGGTSITAAGNNNYRLATSGGSLSKAIVLDPAALGKGYTIRLTGNNPGFGGCTVEAGVGAAGTNIFSPSIWYPGCDAGMMTGCNDDSATILRSAVLEASAFNPNPTAQYAGPAYCGLTTPSHCGPASQSVGVTIDGATHATVKDVAILGFGTCFRGRSAMLTIEDCAGDCHTGFDIRTPDAPFISNVRIERLLTQLPLG